MDRDEQLNKLLKEIRCCTMSTCDSRFHKCISDIARVRHTIPTLRVVELFHLCATKPYDKVNLLPEDLTPDVPDPEHTPS